MSTGSGTTRSCAPEQEAAQKKSEELGLGLQLSASCGEAHLGVSTNVVGSCPTRWLSKALETVFGFAVGFVRLCRWQESYRSEWGSFYRGWFLQGVRVPGGASGGGVWGRGLVGGGGWLLCKKWGKGERGKGAGWGPVQRNRQVNAHAFVKTTL